MNKIPVTIKMHYNTYLELENWDTPNDKIKTIRELADYEVVYLLETIIAEQSKHSEDSREYIACNVDKYFVEGELFRRMWR